MDKDILNGLNNLSEALEVLSNALSKKESKSISGSILQSGQFGKQLSKINLGIKSIKNDTKKILNQQDTIIRMLKNEEKKNNISRVNNGQTSINSSNSSDLDKNTTKSFFGSIDSKKIKDGVSTILMISVGVLSLGLALKIIGKVDILSVIAISLVLPVIALSFQKISTIGIEKKNIPGMILTIVGFSTAITLSSYILSKVSKVSVAQGTSAILIAGVFAVMSPYIGKLINAFGRIGIFDTLKTMIFMPIILLGISTSIMLSSYVLSNVKPIGLFQAMTAILIAGVFTVMSFGLGKLLSAFGKISPIKAIAASSIMPIVLLGISIAISLSSYVLSNVKPIGLFQAMTAILIAGVFTVMSFGLGKIISSLGKVNPVTAIATSSIMPILFLGLSVAIMLSSYALSNVKPIGLLQTLSAIAISIVFVVLSIGIAKIVAGFKNVSTSDALRASFLMPLLFTSMSAAILVSSYALSNVKPIGVFQFLSSVGISLLFIAFAFASKYIVKWTKDLSIKDILKSSVIILSMMTTIYLASFIMDKVKTIDSSKLLKITLFSIGLSLTIFAIGSAFKFVSKLSMSDIIKGSLAILAIATTMMLSSLILSVGKYDKFPSWKWSLGVGLSLTIFAIGSAFKFVSKLSMSDIIKGSLAILAIATTMMLSSLILSVGKYDKFPSWKWSLGVGLSIVGFGLAAVGLGFVISSGIGALAIAAGLVATLAIAGTIVATDKILSFGSYTKFPGAKWIAGVGSSLVIFSTAVVTLGVINAMGGIASTLTLGVVKNPIDAGISAVTKIATLMVVTDKILSTGSFNKSPGIKWALGVGTVLTGFSAAVVTLGIISSGGGLLQKISFGAFKNPIEAGIDAVKKISLAIVYADRILSKGNYTSGPSESWSKGVSLALGSFSPIYSILLKNSGWFKSGVSLSEYTKAIKIISLGIVESANIFNRNRIAFNNGPTAKWADGVSKSLSAFLPIYNILLENNGLFKSGVNPKQFSEAIKTISSGIIDSAYIFNKFKGNFGNTPTSTWSNNISKSIKSFMPIFSEDLVNGFTDNRVFLNKILETMIFIDGKFQSGVWKKFPSETWINGTITSLQKFNEIISMLSFSSVSDRLLSAFGVKNPIFTAVSNIEKLATSFDRLSRSLKVFVESVKQIDNDKLSAIRSLSSNIVMLSLMDSTQFGLMMDKLEEKSGVFSDLIRDFETKSNSNSSGITPYKPIDNSVKKNNDIQIITQKMDTMNALLSDISSVVGSRGTLRDYLSRIKNDVNIGGSNAVSYRSDERLKNIISKVGVSENGINIYNFSYKFNPSVIYQGVIAQELLNTKHSDCLSVDKNGIYSVDYSKIDVVFKRTNN